MKILLPIVALSFALPAFAQAQVSCSLANGSKSLKVNINQNENLQALVQVDNGSGLRLIDNEEVHSVYANGYTAYQNTNGGFYLLVNESMGNGKLILTDTSGNKTTAALYCQSL